MKLKISRPNWMRGMDEGYLCRPGTSWPKSGCCLGHLVTSLGFPLSKISGKTMPCELPAVRMAIDSALPDLTAHKQTEIAEVNDCAEISDKTREQRLKKMFREVGVELIFTNKPNPVWEGEVAG